MAQPFKARIGARQVAGLAMTLCIAASAPASADTLTYVNARFGTRVTFPAKVFLQAMEPPPRGEGMTYKSPDGARLSIYAMNNALELSLLRFVYQSARCHDNDEDCEITYRRVKDNWTVHSGIKAGRVFYERWKFGEENIIHGLMMSYPISEREKYDALVPEISASFDGP